MDVYGITITCSKCIDYTKDEQTTLSRNGRDSWSYTRFHCTCDACGHRFEEIFSLQRCSINISK